MHYIRKHTSIPVSYGLVILKTNFFPFNHPFGEPVSLFTKILDRFLRVFGFRSINTDQSNIFTVGKEEDVSVNDSLYFVGFSLAKRKGEEQN